MADTSGASSDHWSFFHLPPFFTQQSAPVTLERQVRMWGHLVLDHAAHHGPRSKGDTCSALRFYDCHSDVFSNRAIQRRLPSEGAQTMLTGLVANHPNHATVVADGSSSDFSVLVAVNRGGFPELERNLLSWLEERGSGTTAAHLAQKGVVMTIDELVEGKCLYYKQPANSFVNRTSEESVEVGDVGALTEEQAIRTLLHALQYRSRSVLQPFKITLFNLDGSDRQPYQGVKFGGD